VRVLMVFCELVAGGAEVTALELVRRLSGRGYEFTIAAVRSGGVLARAFADAGAKVYQGIARRRFDPLAAGRLGRIIRREDIEIMIVVDVPRNAMFYGFLGAALSGRRIARICWCKSAPGGEAGNFLWQLRAYRAVNLVDLIVCASRFQRRKLTRRGLRVRCMPMIRNGVDLRRFSNAPAAELALPPGKRIIIQVANVTPDKDYATLLAAAGLMAQRRDDFHLLLVGNGTDSPAMVRRIERLGLSGVVTPVGCRCDMPAVLAAGDVFVLSTRNEVFSVATLEALAAGLPVVVSDIPAFDEVFTAGQEGLKVPPGDAAALAGAMASLLDDPKLRRRLSSGALKRAELFSLDRMAEGFDRLLRAVGKTILRRG